jgi:hypothetical protein
MGINPIIPDELQKTAARYFGNAYEVVLAVYEELDIIQAIYDNITYVQSVGTNAEAVAFLYANWDAVANTNEYVVTITDSVAACALSETNAANSEAIATAAETVVTTAEANVITLEANTLAYKEAAETAKAQAEAAAQDASTSANTSVYDETATYIFPNKAIGSDGNTYRCMSTTGITGVDPITADSDDWLLITTSRTLVVVKSTDFEPTKNTVRYLVNTTNGGVTVTLPTSMVDGDEVMLSDYAGTWGTNPVTVVRNGHKIMRLAENITLNVKNASVTLLYIDTTTGVILS